MTETVTRIRPTVTEALDAFKRPIAGVQTEADFTGALVDPGGSTEPVEVGRTPVATTPTVYFPGAWPDITKGDKLRVRGVVYDVEGKPPEWHRGDEEHGGLVVKLRTTGG
jgi:hypothetical protein